MRIRTAVSRANVCECKTQYLLLRSHFSAGGQAPDKNVDRRDL